MEGLERGGSVSEERALRCRCRRCRPGEAGASLDDTKTGRLRYFVRKPCAARESGEGDRPGGGTNRGTGCGSRLLVGGCRQGPSESGRRIEGALRCRTMPFDLFNMFNLFNRGDATRRRSAPVCHVSLYGMFLFLGS